MLKEQAVKARIKALKEELAQQEKSMKEIRANKKILCGCGKYHKIKDCVAVREHYYVPPRGCNEGDYWNYGELQVVCPNNENIINRLLYKSYYQVRWEDRNKQSYNAEAQFNDLYLNLFKKVEDSRKKSYGWNPYKKKEQVSYNNYCVDQNREYFGIRVKGIDY